MRRAVLEFEVLEPRILFAADQATSEADVSATDASAALPSAPATDASLPAAPIEAPATGNDIVFILNSIDGYGALVASLSVAHEVVVVDGAGDGLAQIASALAGHSDLSAIHIISHGRDGVVELGSVDISATALSQYSDVLAQIGRSLSASGDILFYGCDIAAGSDGQALIQNIAKLTAADIAASTDRTGTTAGANLSLEFVQGSVEASVLDLVSTGWRGELSGSNPAISFGFAYQLYDDGDTLDNGTGFDAGTTNPDIDPVTSDNLVSGSNIITSGGLRFTASAASTSSSGTFQDDATIQGNDVGGSIAFTGTFKDSSGTSVSGTFNLSGYISKHIKNRAGTATDSDLFYFWTKSNTTSSYNGLGFYLIVPGNESYFASNETNVSMPADNGWITQLNAFYTAQQYYPTLSINNVTVSEASPYAVFQVSLSASLTSSVSFTPTLASGTGTAGTDTGSTLQYYTGSTWSNVSGAVTIAAGSTSVLLRVAVT